MNRTTLSLIAAATALAAVTGFATLKPAGTSGDSASATAARLPVERTSLLCPQPSSSDIADTTYTSFTPVVEGASGSGKAQLQAAAEESSDSSGAVAGARREGRSWRQRRSMQGQRSPGTAPAFARNAATLSACATC